MSDRITRTEILGLLDIDETFLEVLETERIVVSERGAYARAQIERIRVACSLHRELGVNLAGLEVALHLLDRLHAERAQYLAVLEELRERLGEE